MGEVLNSKSSFLEKLVTGDDSKNPHVVISFIEHSHSYFCMHLELE